MADRFRNGERAYVLDGDQLPVYIGEGLGNIDYKDAIELSIIKRTALGLPASREFITAVAPPPRNSGWEWRVSQSSRASKNNPYKCPHCNHKTTRYGNMVKHLNKAHGDYYTDPRDNR
jgi:hypothetical protein